MYIDDKQEEKKINLRLLFINRYELFGIIRLQTNNILIVANKTFAIIKKEDIEIAKFITKIQACFLLQMSIKCNGIWI